LVIILFIGIVLFLGAIMGNDSVFCYDTNIAHPNIADLAVKVYEEDSGHKLTDEQVNCLRTGAEDEDVPIRWMNHFYDPVYNVGLKSGYLSAKDWSRADDVQRDYALGDQTWQRAIKEYQDGNEEQAFCTLGHILHLIADMSVPAHTRDDAHPTGDSYEQFVKYNWDMLYSGLQNVGMNLIYYSDLDTYFDNLANYSNNNFYSDDTILLKKYKLINIQDKKVEEDQYGDEYLYHYTSLDGGIHRVYVSDAVFGWQDDEEKNRKLKDQYILTDYTKHLLPQAVGNSAGVIKLFFEEVKKDHDFDLRDDRVSFLGKISTMLGWGAEKLAGLQQYIGANKDNAVMADENTVLSIMDPDSMESSSAEAMEDVEVIVQEPEAIYQEPSQPQAVYIPPKVEVIHVDPVNVPVPPGFPETDMEDKEIGQGDSEVIDDSNDNESVEEKEVFYGGGGGYTPPTSTPEPVPMITTSTPTSTPDGIDDDGVTTTSTPSGDEDGIDTTTTSTPAVDGDNGNDTSTTTPENIDDDEIDDDEETEEEIATSTLPRINIISHDEVSYTNVSSTIITVTSSEGVVQIYINTSISELITSSTWQAEVNLTEGENIFNVYGENEEGLQSSTSTIVIILDTTSPEVTEILISPVGSATSTLQIDWQAEDSGVGVSIYDIDYKVDDSDWIILATSTPSSTWQMPAQQFSTYVFRVKAYDDFGYVSDWLESDVYIYDWSKTVVINEIAWMGTSPAKTSDEWLELYNNTNEEVDLSGWKILVSGEEMKWDNAGHILSAGGYYLLERTDDDTVLDVEADAIFTLSGGLGNSGENLILMNSVSSTIDQVDSSLGWFAGAKSNGYRTMERLNFNDPGSLSTNWQTSDSVAPKGRPQGGDVIFGSPGYQNSNYWLLYGDLSFFYQNLITDNKLTLTSTNSPYIISADTIIPAGLTVEIESGVVLMGLTNDASITVKGSLMVSGTEDEPVAFTSALDGSYVNFNLTKLEGDAPEPGDWSRIELEEGGVMQATHTKFLYGGQTFIKGNSWVYGWKWISQVLRNTGGTMTLDNVEVAHNLIDEDEDNQAYNSAIWVESTIGYDANTTIINSLLDSGHTAVNFHGSNNGQTTGGSLTNSTFKNFTDAEAVIRISQAEIEIDNIIFENNLSDFIDMNYLNLTGDYTLKKDTKYLFTGINIPSGKTLTIESGVDVKLSSVIEVGGSLQANGTVDQPINFIPRDNYWNIMLFENSNSNLSNVNIVRGNSGNNSLRNVKKRGMVTIENSTVSFDSVNFMDALRPYQMIYMENSDVNIKDSIISWTDNYTGSKNIDGIMQKGGSLSLDGVTFNRMDRGVEILSSGSISMENMTLGHFQNITDLNWWPASAFSF